MPLSTVGFLMWVFILCDACEMGPSRERARASATRRITLLEDCDLCGEKFQVKSLGRVWLWGSKAVP